MLWEVEIQPAAGRPDREAERVLADSRGFGVDSVRRVRSAKSFLIEGDLDQAAIESAAAGLLVDPVIESWTAHRIDVEAKPDSANDEDLLLNVLFKPGVTDNVAQTAKAALDDRGLHADAVATCRKYWINEDADQADRERLATKMLSNDAIERIVWGPLKMKAISLGSKYRFELIKVPIREMDDAGLEKLSKSRAALFEPRRDANHQAAFHPSRIAIRPMSSWRRWPKPGANTARTKRWPGGFTTATASASCSLKTCSRKPSSPPR